MSPREYVFKFRHLPPLETHHAIIGMAFTVENYPLYYDAMNELGLGMAGLSFPESCRYREYKEDSLNIAPFELIPFILGKCASTDEALSLLSKINLVNTSFSESLPLSP